VNVKFHTLNLSSSKIFRDLSPCFAEHGFKSMLKLLVMTSGLLDYYLSPASSLLLLARNRFLPRLPINCNLDYLSEPIWDGSFLGRNPATSCKPGVYYYLAP
jgi:hypothetical protein